MKRLKHNGQEIVGVPETDSRVLNRDPNVCAPCVFYSGRYICERPGYDFFGQNDPANPYYCHQSSDNVGSYNCVWWKVEDFVSARLSVPITHA